MIFDKIKELYTKADKEASTVIYGLQDIILPKDYVHKWIFRCMLLVMLVLCVEASYEMGGLQSVFVSCPNTTLSQEQGCVNPIHLCSSVPEMYKSKGIYDFNPLNDPFKCYETEEQAPLNACKYGYCDKYKLSAGESYGDSQQSYIILLIIVVLLSILINHGVWIYENRNKTTK